MKDNYSWLREIPIKPGVSTILSDEAVTFIATQIEIEKLRATLKETVWHNANLAYEVGYSGSPHAEAERVSSRKRINDLTEKLKELEEKK